MTTTSEAVQENDRECWCCGGAYPESALVRLGSHPEVGICPRCVRFLVRKLRQRRDETRPGPAARLRSGVRRARSAVMDRGLQRRPLIGPVLRWIDRFLP